MKMKRILSLVLCLCMMASVFSLSAFADEYDPFADLMQQIEQAQKEAQQKLIEDAQKQAEQQLQDILDQLLPDEPEQPEPSPDPDEPKEDEEQPEQTGDFTVRSGRSTYTGSDLYETAISKLQIEALDGTVLNKANFSFSKVNMTNAGYYEITVTGDEGTDYAGKSVTVSYIVDPAVIEVKADDKSKSLGEKDPTLTHNGDPAYVKGSLARERGEFMGTYTITKGTLEPINSNYEIDFTPGVFTINASTRLVNVCNAISKLPNSIDPGHWGMRQTVLNVWVAYLNLTELEKAHVPTVLYDKLYNLVGSTDYAITAGSGGYWYEGKTSGLSFVAIDPYSRFAGIRVDGELVDMKNYNYYHDADNETAVVTLKASYLQTLSQGKHSITICYWNGYCSGYFYVLDKASSPPTGDTANIPLWGGLMLLSCMGIAAAAGVVLKRKKAED